MKDGRGEEICTGSPGTVGGDLYWELWGRVIVGKQGKI